MSRTRHPANAGGRTKAEIEALTEALLEAHGQAYSLTAESLADARRIIDEALQLPDCALAAAKSKVGAKGGAKGRVLRVCASRVVLKDYGKAATRAQLGERMAAFHLKSLGETRRQSPEAMIPVTGKPAPVCSKALARDNAVIAQLIDMRPRASRPMSGKRRGFDHP